MVVHRQVRNFIWRPYFGKIYFANGAAAYHSSFFIQGHAEKGLGILGPISTLIFRLKQVICWSMDKQFLIFKLIFQKNDDCVVIKFSNPVRISVFSIVQIFDY